MHAVLAPCSPVAQVLRRCSQAYRDNYRLAWEDAEQAALLWQASGLSALCEDLTRDGRRSVGLNPNLRLYKCAPPVPTSSVLIKLVIPGLVCVCL